MTRYLITGGAGFIGSHLVHRLVDLGERVRVLDNFSTGKRANLAGLDGTVEVIEGDLCDPESVRRAADGMDYVLHQGALPSVPRSVADPISSNEVNVGGTLNVLVAARDAGVRRVVYAASSSAYGDTPTLPKVETMPAKPLSPYAAAKLAGESYCTAFARSYGLHTCSLRYFNVFGPRQDPQSQYAAVIPKFITAVLRGEAPVIYGDGTQSRDFTYVDNVVAANLLACTADVPPGAVLNIACGVRNTLLELVAEIGRLLGRDVMPSFASARPGDVKHSLADITLARECLGYEVKVSFAEGLARTVEWYRAEGA